MAGREAPRPCPCRWFAPPRPVVHVPEEEPVAAKLFQHSLPQMGGSLSEWRHGRSRHIVPPQPPTHPRPWRPQGSAARSFPESGRDRRHAPSSLQSVTATGAGKKFGAIDCSPRIFSGIAHEGPRHVAAFQPHGLHRQSDVLAAHLDSDIVPEHRASLSP